jgi:hypothetical protein
MVPGFNTDISHDGVDYHVQTEDLGQKHPTILTLVYARGAVVLRETLAYGEILAQDPPESLVRTLMEVQHRRIVGRVAAGEIPSSPPPMSVSDGPPSFGLVEPIVPTTPQSVDDLINAYVRARRRTKTS